MSIGALLFILTVVGVIYLIGLLSDNIFSALAPGKINGGEPRFDLEGYKKLELR